MIPFNTYFPSQSQSYISNFQKPIRISGRKIAQSVLNSLSQRIKSLSSPPCLGIILAGEHKPSYNYVKHKIRAAESIGINTQVFHLNNQGLANVSSPLYSSKTIFNISEFQSKFVDYSPSQHLKALINILNQDQNIDGILLQLPIPPEYSFQYNESTSDDLYSNFSNFSDLTQPFLSRHETALYTSFIDPTKDVDGLHFTNVGRMTVLGQSDPKVGFIACTPKAVIECINSTDFEIQGSDVVIIGRSPLVGRPLANLMLHKMDSDGTDATVTITHTRSKNLDQITKKADLVISAAGSPHLVKPSWIKPGVFLIDVGITIKEDGKVYGDIDPQCYSKSIYYTPVPGGVGPVTVSMLLENTVLARERKEF